jgi:hypothetical protein
MEVITGRDYDPNLSGRIPNTSASKQRIIQFVTLQQPAAVIGFLTNNR